LSSVVQVLSADAFVALSGAQISWAWPTIVCYLAGYFAWPAIALLIANFSPMAWGDHRHHLVLEISGCANAFGLFIIMAV